MPNHTLPRFYPQQASFIDSPAHFAAFIGGIGSGKTTAGAARALLAAYGTVAGRGALLTPNLGMITAPTYTMLRDASLRAFMEMAGAALDGFSKSEMLARLANGSEVLFRSAHAPDRLRGPSLAWWWGDEAALYEALVWQIMIGRLRQHGQLGYAWLSSTPRGRNWLWRAFVRDNADNPDYALIRARTADNIFLDAAILDAWQHSFIGDFARQELDAEFVAYEGLVYAEFDQALHVTDQRPAVFTRVLAGVDWGYNNPGVILVGGLDYDDRLYLLHEDYARRRSVEGWLASARHLRELWDIEAFYCDPSDPDNLAQFVAAGLPAFKADNRVRAGLQRVKARLIRQPDGLPRLLVAPALKHTLAEFDAYQWAPARDGLAEAPLKRDDHALDALRYLVLAVDTRPAAPAPVALDLGQWG